MGQRARAIVVVVLLIAATAATAHAASDCMAGGGEVTVTSTGDTSDVIIGRSGNAITVDGTACAGATVNNTDRIVVVESVDDGGLNLFIDLSGGLLAPGATAENDGASEIEVVFDFGRQEDDYDALIVLGSSGPDDIRFGLEGATFTTDGDADVNFDGNVPDLRMRAQSGAGADDLSGQGGRGTGPAQDTGVDLFGEDGNDTLTGSIGGDRLEGGPGADDIDGGNGDVPAPYTPWNVIGFDSSPAGVTVDLAAGTATGGDADGDTYTGIDSVFGSAFDDVIRGDAQLNALLGGDGRDLLDGRAGDDYLEGGNDPDEMLGGEGLDSINYWGSEAPLDLDLGAGTASGDEADGDTFSSIEKVGGSPNDDRIVGDDGPNELEGYYGDDVIIAKDGDDYLKGSPGRDEMRGGPGDDYLSADSEEDGPDIIDGGDGSDYVDYYGRSGSLHMSSDNVANDGSPGEGDNLISIEEFGASDSNDIVDGSGSDDILLGKGGNDALGGAGGNDTLNGGDDPDEIEGGKGADRLVGGDGRDTLNGGGGKDTCVVFEGDRDRVRNCERVVTKRHR